jgi:hypothetical protein
MQAQPTVILELVRPEQIGEARALLEAMAPHLTSLSG